MLDNVDKLMLHLYSFYKVLYIQARLIISSVALCLRFFKPKTA